ncbi:MAG: HAMP domain-containing histidine kinase, partial [Saprospiraceae bacterium]|nr:HAMP domain-containing histidine kinase [Saprospiraceae bacterium]
VINYYFTNVVIFITFGILIGSLAFLKWISEKNEDQNIELIKDLNKTNEVLVERNTEIESQSAEILAQSDVLQNNQNQLLEANRLIAEQRQLLFNKNQSLESELVLRNAELVETNSELIKHNNELRQFSYTVSHNLRGPVASLLGLIDLIEQEKLDEGDQEVFSYIGSSADQLDQIIKDLTKIIDIRHDIFKIRQKIDLQSEIDEVIKVLRRELEEHQVLVLNNLSSCSQIYSIKPMVNSILYNLISNAVKYRSNERQLTIEINTREEEDFYVLEILDNGLGIDLKQNRDSLFKLYKRFHFHTEGKGLGLYLIKLQCEALGGNVDIESEINRFAKFTVRLQKPLNIDRQILYQEKHAEIFFDARINATGVIWRGPISSSEYRSVFTKCLDFVHSYNTPNYIADISNQGPISKMDQQWMFQEILPHALHHGLKKISIVHNNLTDPVIKEYLAGIEGQLLKLRAAQRFFVSLDDAFDWIHQENEGATLQVGL